MSLVFVVNSGSSSIKWQLVDADSGVARGDIVERIGESGGGALDHNAAMTLILAKLGDEHPVAIGHRVVHGGTRFASATLVTGDVEDAIDQLAVLAPLHNPANLTGIRAARLAFPGVPNVAVFDTAFHQSLPPAAFTYAIDSTVAVAHGVRRYGFHGTSYQYVCGQAAEILGRPLEQLKLVAFHLGNGASAAAIDGGRSVATSMGLTPLEGLVMGTRSGDVDPGAILHLARSGMSPTELEELLNRRSGLLGLSGRSDMREVLDGVGLGNRECVLALEVYIERLRHYLGAYLVALRGADAIVFTGGVGENSAVVRAKALAGLESLGIQLDDALNDSADRGARIISREQSPIAALVVPTNEELEIARQALALLAG